MDRGYIRGYNSKCIDATEINEVLKITGWFSDGQYDIANTESLYMEMSDLFDNRKRFCSHTRTFNFITFSCIEHQDIDPIALLNGEG